jgi:hypothetical protein
VDKNLNSTAHVVSRFLLILPWSKRWRYSWLARLQRRTTHLAHVLPILIFSLPSPAAHATIRLDAVRQAAARVDPVAASPLHPYTTAHAAGAEQLHGRSGAGGEKQLDHPLAPASPALARQRLPLARFPSHLARTPPYPPLWSTSLFRGGWRRNGAPR